MPTEGDGGPALEQLTGMRVSYAKTAGGGEKEWVDNWKKARNGKPWTWTGIASWKGRTEYVEKKEEWKRQRASEGALRRGKKLQLGATVRILGGTELLYELEGRGIWTALAGVGSVAIGWR